MLGELAAKIRDADIKVDTVTCEGDPARIILRHATSVSADLIAMGTHGRSGMDRLFLGSTAARVVTSAPCAVLTVRFR
jgi:nucleotide-binding universal stress UspA family protein